MSLLLAIDPGNVQSAYVLYDRDLKRPVAFEKRDNDDILTIVSEIAADAFAIEVIASYGMAVGREVFETCIWIGRFIERWYGRGDDPLYWAHDEVYRRDVKLHLCGSSKAKDANIRQALIDRYGPGKEKAIGKKASPGPLYGMARDCWAALGVAVTASEVPA